MRKESNQSLRTTVWSAAASAARRRLGFTRQKRRRAALAAALEKNTLQDFCGQFIGIIPLRYEILSLVTSSLTLLMGDLSPVMERKNSFSVFCLGARAETLNPT